MNILIKKVFTEILFLESDSMKQKLACISIFCYYEK